MKREIVVADGVEMGMSADTSGFDRETVLAAIRVCVTVVRPGEVLVVRAPTRWTAQQMSEARRYAREIADEHGATVVFVPGEEFAVVTAHPDPLDLGGVIATAPGEER